MIRKPPTVCPIPPQEVLGPNSPVALVVVWLAWLHVPIYIWAFLLQLHVLRLPPGSRWVIDR